MARLDLSHAPAASSFFWRHKHHVVVSSEGQASPVHWISIFECLASHFGLWQWATVWVRFAVIPDWCSPCSPYPNTLERINGFHDRQYEYIIINHPNHPRKCEEIGKKKTGPKSSFSNFQASSSSSLSSTPTMAGPRRRRGPIMWAGSWNAAACSGLQGHKRTRSSSGGARPRRFKLFGEWMAIWSSRIDSSGFAPART